MRGEGQAPLEENQGHWRRPWVERGKGEEGHVPKILSLPLQLTQQSPGLAFHPSGKNEEPAAASYDRRLPALN